MLQEQNRELESELERFLVSDNEIRQKLMDRDRSPLKMNDLYKGDIKATQYQPPEERQHPTD